MTRFDLCNKVGCFHFSAWFSISEKYAKYLYENYHCGRECLGKCSRERITKKELMMNDEDTIKKILFYAMK